MFEPSLFAEWGKNTCRKVTVSVKSAISHNALSKSGSVSMFYVGQSKHTPVQLIHEHNEAAGSRADTRWRKLHNVHVFMAIYLFSRYIRS